MGGMVSAIEQGFPQREIQNASYEYQMAVERKEKIIVGVNDFISEEPPIPVLLIDESVGERQISKLKGFVPHATTGEFSKRWRRWGGLHKPATST
jgi:methylmalonyl-CoA mutase N-terminal domain/subunit